MTETSKGLRFRINRSGWPTEGFGVDTGAGVRTGGRRVEIVDRSDSMALFRLPGCTPDPYNGGYLPTEYWLCRVQWEDVPAGDRAGGVAGHITELVERVIRPGKKWQAEVQRLTERMAEATP